MSAAPRAAPPLMEGAVSWVAETLDYEPLQAHPSADPRLSERDEAVQARFRLVRNTIKLLGTVLAALAIGATAAAVHHAIGSLLAWRNAVLAACFRVSLLQAYGAHVAISVCLAFLATAAVQLYAPKAAGGGVTLVMAYLNGNALEGLFTLPVFGVKAAGTVAAIVASLCLGMEAPMVHMGASLTALFNDGDQLLWSWAAQQRWLRWLLGGREYAAAVDFDDNGKTQAVVFGAFRKNLDRREAVSAGAAAGIAAAFGAPIGGVLFSLEEACSVWSRRIAWRCFLCASLAVVAHATLNPHAANGMLSSSLRRLTPAEWLQQLPAIVAVSVGGGLLGALFNRVRLALRPWRPRPKHHTLRLRRTAGMAVLTVTVIAVLAARVGRCLPVPQLWADTDERMWVQHACPEGQYNDLATAWLASPVWSIRSLIALGTEHTAGAYAYTPATLASMCGAYLLLMSLSSSLTIPGGLFMPSLMVGGTFGALCGLGLLQAAPPGWRVEVGLYALVGGAAVLGSVFRGSISTVVLIAESCGTLAPMLGVIVSVVTSNLVAIGCGTEGMYESELEHELHMNYLSQAPPPKLRPLVAEQLMATPAVGLPRIVPAAQAESLLRYSRHHGFPVYDPLHVDAQTGAFRVDGLVMRSQIELLLQHRVYCDRHGRYLQPPPPGLDTAAWERRLAAAMTGTLQHAVSIGALRTLRSGGATSSDLLAPHAGGSGHEAFSARPSPFDNQAVVPHISLAPFMNTAPVTVRLDTPDTRVHAMLVSLSLRHIVVTDENNYARGMITRRDLAHAAGSLLERTRTGAGQAHHGLDAASERPGSLSH